MITPEPPARVLFGERLARAPRAIGKSFIARAASPAISLILVPQLLCHPVVPATIFEPSCEFLEATPNRRRFGITHTCFSTASVSRPSAGATDGSLECHEPTFRAFRKRFPGDQQVRPVQPSRGSLRLGSTCQSSGLLIGLTRVRASRAGQFSDHSGLMFKRCRFFPRFSLSRHVDLTAKRHVP